MKVGVLGAGKMGESVVQHLKECPDVTGIATYDVAEGAVRTIQEKFGSSHICCRGVTDFACRSCAECACERESGRHANRGLPEEPVGA